MKSITRDELLAEMDAGDTVVVNVLAKIAYDKIRIKGSVSIPRNELVGGRWTELDRNKEIVVHCSSFSCGASREAADFLETKGFRVRAYEGGIKEWAEADLPVEGTISAKEYLVERYGRPSEMKEPDSTHLKDK